jgi:hypothetical protein
MKWILVVLALAVLAGPALAQSQADFVKAFAGKWQVYDQRMGMGSAKCTFDLATAQVGKDMVLSASNCAAPFGGAVGWLIDGNQLVLEDAQGKTIVRLGGNQKRITGTTESGIPIVIERPGGDGNATRLQGAYNISGCYYVGYSQNCAPQSDLVRPATESGPVKVRLDVNAALHSEPRGDADTVGTVKQGTCVAVNACTVASDGPWCRVALPSGAAWLRKMTLRQNRWPIITFSNSCS